MTIKSLIQTFILIIALLTGNFKPAFGVIDVGVTAIIQPTCTVVPGVSQSIIVVITNFGTNVMTSLPVGFLLSGTTPVVQTWNGSLAPSASDTFEFAVPIIFPSGPFSFCSYTLPGDADPSNDTTCISCNGTPMSVNANQNCSIKKIIVYPNPTSGIFSLIIEDKTVYNISMAITDILGKVVWKSDIRKPEFYIDISNEINGMYQISILSSSGISNSKLILAK